MSEIEPAIVRVMEAYKAAVAARDIVAFMRLYDPVVRVFDAWGVWTYEGAAPWQVAVEGWFTSRSNDRLTATFEDVNAVSTPAFACLSAIVSYTVVSAQGEPLNAMQNRLSWVLKTSGHVPRIIHEHTSSPIGFEDGKAILERPARP